MKIAVVCGSDSRGTTRGDITPILAARGEFKKLGIEVFESDHKQKKCDAFYVLSDFEKMVEVLDAGKPVFMQDKIDGAQLGRAKWWIDHPRVKAVIKGYAYKDRASYNWHDGRRHSVLLTKEIVPPEVKIAGYNKIQIGHGFGAWDRMILFRGPVPQEKKKIKYDAFFAGTIDYKGRKEISAHRKAAYYAVNKLPLGKAVAGRGLPITEYQKHLAQTRAVVSPWGYGEACFRDYEALLSGCVLIKPDCRHVESWPDIYREGETYFRCAADFSDLAKVLNGAHLSLEQRQANWRLARSALDPALLAKHYAKIFNKGMNQ